MLASFLGIAMLYVGGVTQLELLTGSLSRAAALGSTPFILADLGKVVVAAIISPSRAARPPA
jgi:biotin transporter BioY